MKIAVIGLYYASNLGDAVICDCVAKWFREAYPQAQIDIIDITGNTQFMEEEAVSFRILKKRQKNLRRDYWLTRHGFDDKVYYWANKNTERRKEFFGKVADRGYDIAVFAGGQIFMDWLSLDICEFLKHFQRTNTPVYFNACGVGISISPAIRKLLSSHLNTENIKFISSRDDVDAICSHYFDGAQSVTPTYDPALWTKETYQIEKSESQIIGLGIMYCSQISAKKLIRFWVYVIKELERRRMPWKMFCNGAIDDYHLGCAVLEKLHLDPQQYMCPCAKRPETLVAQIAGFKAIISFRLHSHIIAASYGIPAIALVWDEKLRFFYRHMKHEERCMTINDSADSIINGLHVAIKENYDQTLLKQQKVYAKELLMNTIHI